MSIILGKQGDLPAAVRAARGALKEYAREGHRTGEAAALHRLAELTLRVDPRRGPEADQLLTSGLEALGDVDDATLRARLHSLRGRVLTELGRHAEAVSHSARALLIRSWFPRPVGNDAHWLRRQREALGDDAFGRELEGALGPGPAAELTAGLGAGG